MKSPKRPNTIEKEIERLITFDLPYLKQLERLARQKYLQKNLDKINYLVVKLARSMKEAGA